MKYKVSYVIDGGGSSVSEIQAYIEEELGGQDLEITELLPEPEDGWYQDCRYDDNTPVLRWTVEEIKDYGAEVFYRNYTRMKAPEPWVAPVEPKYQDGYYRMAEEHLYRRDVGVWTFYLQCSGDWVKSSCSDSTIGRDFSVRYLGVDAP